MIEPRAYAGCRLCSLERARQELGAFAYVDGLQSTEEEESRKTGEGFVTAWAEPITLDAVTPPWRLFVNVPVKAVKWNGLQAHWAKVLVLGDTVPAAVHDWLVRNKVRLHRCEHNRLALKKELTRGTFGVVFEAAAAHALCEFVDDCPEGAKLVATAAIAAGLPQPVSAAALLSIRRSFGRAGYAKTKTKFSVDGGEVATHLGRLEGVRLAATVPRAQAVGTFGYLKKACSNRPKSVLWTSTLWQAFMEKKLSQKSALFLVAYMTWQEARWESTLTEGEASSDSMADPPGRKLLSTLWSLPTFPTPKNL